MHARITFVTVFNVILEVLTIEKKEERGIRTIGRKHTIT